MINASTGLVVDNTCAGRPGDCLSCLIDTSGGSDDGFQQSDTNSIVQAWVYYGMREVARLARWLGELDTATRLEAKMAAMKEAFNRLMINGAGAVCDGLCSHVGHTSIHSSFYALGLGIIDEQHTQGAFDYIKSRITSSPVGFPGGAYPIQFLLLALYGVTSDGGHLAYDVLTSEQKHGWIAMMRDYNATTTMECWSPDELPNLSFSHIWSASPAFIIPWFLGGVRPLTPGFAKLEIKPQPGPLAHFSLVMPTIKGPVHSNITQWFGDGGELKHFRLQALVPGNAKAVLHVPAPPDRTSCVLLNGHRMLEVPSAHGTHLAVEVHSGAHVMQWCGTQTEV